jgi:hypothetical protein
MATGSLPGPAEPHSQIGPEAGRRVALLVDAEPLGELPARDPRAAPRPVTGRPAISRGHGAVRGATRVAQAGPHLERSEVEHGLA